MKTGCAYAFLASMLILALTELTTPTHAADAGASGNSTVKMSTTPIPSVNVTDKQEMTSESGSSAGMIAGIIVGVLVVVVVVVVLLVVFLRSKRFSDRKSENDRAVQVQMASARNAGVYVDLVTSDPNAKDGTEATETEKLKKQDDEPEDV